MTPCISKIELFTCSCISRMLLLCVQEIEVIGSYCLTISAAEIICGFILLLLCFHSIQLISKQLHRVHFCLH